MTQTLPGGAQCQHVWVRMTDGLGGASEMCQRCGTVVRISTTSSAGPCRHSSWYDTTDFFGNVIGRNCSACGQALFIPNPYQSVSEDRLAAIERRLAALESLIPALLQPKKYPDDLGFPPDPEAAFSIGAPSLPVIDPMLIFPPSNEGPKINMVDDMIARDHFEPEANPFDKRLRDLAEKAIVQGKAEAGVKALEPIAEPKVDTTGQRNLGKQF